MLNYKLTPPFLFYPEKESFPDIWELFTCKLLNLENKTNEIYIRNPPEQGIDLFFPSNKIAYQCKSVESGKSGDFNVSHAINSIKSAKKAKKSCSWEKYALCTNVPITGTAEAKLREELSDIILLPESYWVHLCEKFQNEVERNFRILLEIPRERLSDSINSKFVKHYSQKLHNHLNDCSYHIFLFSNRHENIYRIEVANEFKVRDLLGIFRSFFNLPESKTIESEGIKISLSHSVVHEGKKIPLNKTLLEAGIKDRDLVTYWTTFCWEEDNDQSFNHDVIHYISAAIMHRATATPHIERSQAERKDSALIAFGRIINKKFEEFDRSLEK